MTKDSKCKCTFAQSLVGDGCRCCHLLDYIDRLRDEIRDMQDDYDKLFNEKATAWNLTVDWQGLSDDEIYPMADVCYSEFEGVMGKGFVFDRYKFARAIEVKLKEKNHG